MTDIPLVAVVGRPNVGKSTLFNRLVGFRKAITDSTPGVTRDPVSATVELGGRGFRLVDTGGVVPRPEGLDLFVVQRSMRAIEEASLVLFVVDVTEFTAEDEEFLAQLRRYAEKTVLVVNKVDNEARRTSAYDFFGLGLADMVAVSAAHGIGMGDLEDLIQTRLAESTEAGGPVAENRTPAEDGKRVRIAVMGQPNTGKSTLANALVRSEISIVSDIPGTTRDIVEAAFDFRGVRFELVDTAGIRRKRSVESDVEYYSVNRAVRAAEEADVTFLLVDADKGFSEQDKKIAAILVRRGKGIILVLNKWDLRSNLPNEFEAVVDRLRFIFPVLSFAPVLRVSALKQMGMEKLLSTAIAVHSQLNRRIETGKLNASLRRWLDATPPPSGPKNRFKVKYMTQAEVAPLRFIVFVNRSKGFPDSYVSYLKNRLRAEFGFSSVPLSVELRS